MELLRVDFDGMYDVSERLHTQNVKLKNITDEIAAVAQKLNGSSLQELRSSIIKENYVIQAENEELYKLSDALKSISEIYRIGEKIGGDRAEEAGARKGRLMEWFDIPISESVSNSLQKIIY